MLDGGWQGKAKADVVEIEDRNVEDVKVEDVELGRSRRARLYNCHSCRLSAARSACDSSGPCFCKVKGHDFAVNGGRLGVRSG